ncbi:hypothetical protein ACTHUE_19685 [Neisseria sp. P0021.S005]|uniref:hypothetical protein n=1 Tax=Neisseria sp. P0021.S005 TaxID=3436820 RepID=UPI003F7EB1E8
MVWVVGGIFAVSLLVAGCCGVWWAWWLVCLLVVCWLVGLCGWVVEVAWLCVGSVLVVVGLCVWVGVLVVWVGWWLGGWVFGWVFVFLCGWFG